MSQLARGLQALAGCERLAGAGHPARRHSGGRRRNALAVSLRPVMQAEGGQANRRNPPPAQPRRLIRPALRQAANRLAQPAVLRPTRRCAEKCATLALLIPYTKPATPLSLKTSACSRAKIAAQLSPSTRPLTFCLRGARQSLFPSILLPAFSRGRNHCSNLPHPHCIPPPLHLTHELHPPFIHQQFHSTHFHSPIIILFHHSFILTFTSTAIFTSPAILNWPRKTSD